MASSVRRGKRSCFSLTNGGNIDSDDDETLDDFASDEENSESESSMIPATPSPENRGITSLCAKRARKDVSDTAQESSESSGDKREAYEIKDPLDWSSDEVKKWISSLFDNEIVKKFEEQEVDGQTLLWDTVLTEESLNLLGMGTIGRKAKFKAAVLKLKEKGTKEIKKVETVFSGLDRLLTNKEKDTLTSSERSAYNTKKKRILNRIKQKWPDDQPIPWYRHNATSTKELQTFVETLSQDEECTFPKAGLKKKAIEEIVRKHVQERRRNLRDPTTSEQSDSPSVSSSPEISKAKRTDYDSYFNKDLSAMSAQAIVLTWMGIETIHDLRMESLKKEAKQMGLKLLRNKNKATHIQAIASTLLKDGKITIDKAIPLSKVAKSDVLVTIQ